MIGVILLLLIILWIPCSIRMALKQIETWKINKERHGKYFPTNKEKYGKWFPTRQDKRMYEQMWFEKKANSPQPPSEKIEAHKDKPELLQQIKNSLYQPVSSRQILTYLAIIFVFAFLYIIGTWSYDSKPKPLTMDAIKPLSNVQTQKPLTIGVTYNQIMKYLDKDISMSKSYDDYDDYGQPSYEGRTSDKSVFLRIIGNSNNVSQTSVAIRFPKDATKITVRDSGILRRFILNTVPEWEGGADWLNSALKRISSTKKEGQEKIIIGNKVIKLSFMMPPLHTIIVVVKHKDAI